MNKTLVLGASTNTQRYSNMAIHRLVEKGHALILVGNRQGEVLGLPIHNQWPHEEAVHTVTLYLSASKQHAYYPHILSTGIQRLIFNPGTENVELAKLAQDKGIEVLNACTLVMLAINQY